MNGITLNHSTWHEINDNAVNNYETGIGVYNSVGTDNYDNVARNYILRNDLNVGIQLDRLTRFGTTGIENQNAMISNIPVEVSSNTIYNSRNGIYMINTNDSRVGIDATDYNTIIDESLPDDVYTHYGIWLVNCGTTEVNNNLVEWTGGTVDDDDYLASHKGIALQSVGRSSLTENTIINYGTGFNIHSACIATKLLCNEMKNCFHGVYLDPGSTTSLLSTQGEVGVNAGTTKSWDNKWTNNVGATKVDGQTWLNQPIIWVYDASLPSNPDYSPIPSATFVTAQPGNLHAGCTIPQTLNEEQRNEMYGDAAGDSTDTDGDSLEFTMIDKQIFYQQAKANPGILELNVASDTDYENAFAALEETNIGKYEEVKEAFSINDKVDALLKLAAITDDNLIENNKKYVATLIAIDFNPAMDADSDTVIVLNSLAYLHPFYGGEAVYWARGILHLKIEDEMPALRKGESDIQNIVSTIPNGTLQPNPASNSVTLKYKSKNELQNICIFNMLGQLMDKFSMTENEITFSTGGYKEGIYQVMVYKNDLLRETHKLIIIK